MDAHTETATVEAPEAEVSNPVDSIPEESSATDVSFLDAIDQAFDSIGKPTEEAQEPVAEEPAKTEEEVAEAVTEEPKVEEAKEEPKEEVQEEVDSLESLTESIGDDWTPKAANRFKELKSELKTSRSELDELRQLTKEQTSKLEEMSAMVENKDIEALQEKLASYEQDRAFNDLESTEAYQQAVSEPINEILDAASSVADHYDVNPDILIDILALENAEDQDTALEEYFPNMSTRDKAKIYRMIEDIDPILKQREEMFENIDVALNEAKALEEERQKADLAERVQLRQNVTKNVVNRVKEKLPFLSGLDDVNLSEIQEKAAELDPTVVHPVDFAYGAVAAELLPKIVRQYFSSQKEVEALMDKLSEYEEAEPTMSGAPATDGSNVSKANANLSFEEAIAAALG
tara:strand:- start:8163 stop:9374 length:1212 start_codon:yes stop_codon:yes gene_type:complete